jgi:hypothetical protein
LNYYLNVLDPENVLVAEATATLELAENQVIII